MTAWQIALQQLNPGAYEKKCICGYCGAQFTKEKGKAKKYCDANCYRKEKYLRARK